MYVDCLYNRKTNRVQIAERVNGQRILREDKYENVFYYSHPVGSHTSIFGDPCKKYSSFDARKAKRELQRLKDKGTKIFESDIKEEFRHLAKHYSGAVAPKLNLCFFDIETDFHADKGFAPTDDPFNAVTAITAHLSQMDRMITLVLCPSTLTREEAETIVQKSPDTYLFTDEADMLMTFLDLIEDSDVLSGWNCIDLNENVWLEDRIITLRNVTPGTTSFQNGKVLKWKNSGNKQVNSIKLNNGRTLRASDEHVIPISFKEPNQYLSPSTMGTDEKTVSEIKAMMAAGTQVYMSLPLRKNQNEAYTYRQFVLENLDRLMALDWFDIVLQSQEAKSQIKSALSEKEFGNHFPYSRKFSSSTDYPKTWRSKNFPCVSRQLLEQEIREFSHAVFYFESNRPVYIDLSEPIPLDVLQILGLQFTDGTFYRKDKSFTLYGSDENQMTWYRDAVLRNCVSNGAKNLRAAKDGCYAIDYRRGSPMGLLAAMIYDASWNKSLNSEILSRLSEEQFSAFFSGLIDGDGYLGADRLQFCNFDGNIAKLQELLQWQGVYATATENVLCISALDTNQDFVSGLTIRKENRQTTKLLFTKPINSPNAKLRKFVFDDHVLIRVDEILETEEYVEMGDIQTTESYFVCNGIRVHNSEGYDIPYMVNRISRVIDQNATRRFCLWNQAPRPREYLKFGKTFNTYDLVGRVHLDYLILYQKHNTQQQHSYRLDFIGEIEVGEKKVPYEGTLDDLYKKDFEKFIAYNRQDVALLVKIDAKRKFIELANQIAHANCVLLKTTVGSVALVEQAIINEMHTMGFVVPERRPREDDAFNPTTKYAKKPVSRPRIMQEVIDYTLVEDRLFSIIEEMSSEERNVVFATLTELPEDPIEEQETFLNFYAEYLEKNQPALMDSIVKEFTRMEEVEDMTPEFTDDDDDDDEHTPVVGAYVAKPRTGIHRDLTCVDINSLYPSAIRALNMSPETIIGQIRSDETAALVETRILNGTPRAEAWEGIFCLLEISHMRADVPYGYEFTDEIKMIPNEHKRWGWRLADKHISVEFDSSKPITIDFEDGRVVNMTGRELREYVFNPKNNVCITANGTIFRTDKDGIIPKLLAKWYSERQHQQSLERSFGELAKGVEIDEELAELLKAA